jgi:putative ABC transport system permease protein
MNPSNFFNSLLEKVLQNSWLSRSTFLNEEQLRISIEGVLNHKLRSLLTILGIIFGVAAVISMLAIGEGARRKTMSQIQSLGLQNIIVQQEETETENDEGQNLLALPDVDALRAIVPNINNIAPVVERDYEATYKSRVSEIVLTGTYPEYLSLMNLKISSGGVFSHYENKTYQRVCILGAQAAKELFLVESPLGKKIKINGVWFTVIGVLKYQPKSIAGTKEVDLNSNIFAPINSVNIRFDREDGESELEQIILQLSNDAPVIATSNLVDQILYRRHNQVKNYSMIVPEQLLQQSEETQKIFNIVMGAIAGISLLVGGIGIMNIMLASVLERTREIGIRRSLGATRKDVLNQFLTEALILSLFGGLIGIAVGYTLALGITFYSDWDTAVSAWSVIISFGVSSGVGVVFGYYPAKQAASLNPIEALRYE